MKTGSITHSEIRHHRLKWVLTFALIVSAALSSWWYLFLRPTVASDDAYVMGNVIPIQALVPGIVSRIGVDNSMRVSTGQWLLSEEHNLTDAQMRKAEANLAASVRQTRSLFAQVKAENAEIAAIRAQKKKLVSDLARYVKAQKSEAVSSQQVSDTQADVAVINSKLASALSKLRKTKVLVEGTGVNDNPLVRKASAEFVESYIQYRRSKLFSPVNGYVAGRRVQAGEQVKAGQVLMSVVPLDELWVTANLKETRLARVRTGEDVIIHADVYGSGTNFHGKVIGIEPSGGSTFSLFPPNNATGNYIHIVERVPVRISIPASELKSHPLRPGMSVKVNINTKNFKNFPPLVTEVTTTGKSYRTAIYQKELAEARRAAQKVINDN